MPDGYVSPVTTEEGRHEIATKWRRRASELDTYARALRREGASMEAFDAETAANDYRDAADALEGAAHA